MRQIDLLFPEWLHVVGPDGSLTAYTSDNVPFAVVDSAGVHGVDPENKIVRAITDAKEDTEIFPMVNNYSPTDGVFEQSVEQFLLDPGAQANFVRQTDQFVAANTRYSGITLDFQGIPQDATAAYDQLVQSLANDLHQRKLKLYVNVPVNDDSVDMQFMGSHADGVVLMNYDQHETGTDPGPVAGQDWFEDNLRNAMKVVPREKIICSIGNYGYDWTTPLPPAAGARRRGHPWHRSPRRRASRF